MSIEITRRTAGTENYIIEGTEYTVARTGRKYRVTVTENGVETEYNGFHNREEALYFILNPYQGEA